jgi:alanine dehydrogenase
LRGEDFFDEDHSPVRRGAAGRHEETELAAMRIGVPSEIKSDEYRVAITPAGVRELSSRGHDVLVQAGAGEGSAMGDDEFRAQGAQIVPDAEAVFDQAELVLKVKEPQPGEVAMLRAGQTLFTYLHLAAEPELARGLQESGATCIAYETVEDDAGRLPLLAPMSEVAGKIATQAGAFMLEKPLGGRGILLGGVPGVAAATVLVIGGGVVGMNAAFIAIGMQADASSTSRSAAARRRSTRRRSRSSRCCRSRIW